MADLVVPLVALATAAALLVVGVGVFVVRRSLIARGMGTFDCSMRREGTQHKTGGWMLGVARYERDRLDWFRVFTLSPRPTWSLTRSRLIIQERRAPRGAEAHAIMPGWVIVRCVYGHVTLEFAMSEPAYSGLSTWLESAPPGQNVSIT